MSKRPIRMSLLVALPATAFVLLSACATPTPYQPIDARGEARGGYFEQRLEDNRFRVTFRGNEFTSRQTVENYLLFRAAELTLQAGYDGFTMVNRAVDPNQRTRVTSDPFGPGPWGFWARPGATAMAATGVIGTRGDPIPSGLTTSMSAPSPATRPRPKS